MAFGACYGSPMLNIVIGMSVGISLSLLGSSNGLWKSVFIFHPLSVRVIFCLCWLVFNLLLTLIYVIRNSYKADFRLGIMLYVSYFVFGVVNLLIE